MSPPSYGDRPGRRAEGTAIISHLHQDHIGGLRWLGRATIVFAGEEWRSLKRPMAAVRGLLGTHIDLDGLRWNRVRAERLPDSALAPFTRGHDLFGDGSLVLLPRRATRRGRCPCSFVVPPARRC